MKQLTFAHRFFGLMIFLGLTSCTDVIDLDLDNIEPRLVIEASIDWEDGTSGADQTIKLSMSTPMFEQQDIPVTGATVTITNDQSNDVFNFIDQNNGNYTTTSFVPVLNQTYTLEVTHNGETFSAQETLIPLPLINEINVFQSTEEFDEDLLEVNIEFNNPANEENYYLIKFQELNDQLPDFRVLIDEYFDGRSIPITSERDRDEDTNQRPYFAGDVVKVELFAISKRYYQYFDLIDSQLGAGENPFGTTPVEIKGNIINQTNPANRPFGYFRLTSFYRQDYTFN